MLVGKSQRLKVDSELSGHRGHFYFYGSIEEGDSKAAERSVVLKVLRGNQQRGKNGVSKSARCSALSLTVPFTLCSAIQAAIVQGVLKFAFDSAA